ncbi:DUF2147 domain-containing protein [Roseovarius aquimarinus]|uniref:DUF2147 domain-containing protein n=1 Tax=Roseovarius aquimarinus TaxID=1229156 RepID=A0ABW7I4W1_9RHOB
MKAIAWGALALAISAGMAMADPLEGIWQTPKDDNGNSGLVRIAPCGAQLCGTLIKAYGPGGEEIASDNIGRAIVSETVPTGGGAYEGKIYSPDRGKTYASKLSLSNGTLAVKGCVFGICRDGGTWRRVQ